MIHPCIAAVAASDGYLLLAHLGVASLERVGWPHSFAYQPVGRAYNDPGAVHVDPQEQVSSGNHRYWLLIMTMQRSFRVASVSSPENG